LVFCGPNNGVRATIKLKEMKKRIYLKSGFFIACLALFIVAGFPFLVPKHAYASVILYSQTDSSVEFSAVDTNFSAPNQFASSTGSLSNSDSVFGSVYFDSSTSTMCSSNCRVDLFKLVLGSPVQCNTHVLSPAEESQVNSGMTLLSFEMEVVVNSCSFSAGDSLAFGLYGQNKETRGADSSHMYAVFSSAPVDINRTRILSTSPTGFETVSSPVQVSTTFYNGTSTPVLFVRFQLFDTSIGGGDGYLWRQGDSQLSFLQATTTSYSNFFSAYPTGDWALHTILFDRDYNVIDSIVSYFTVFSDSSGYQNFVPSQSYATTTGFLYLPNFTNSTVGTTTLSLSDNLLGFLNVPQLLRERFPFALFFQTKEVLDSASSTESSSIGSISISVHLAPNSTSTYELFSTSTITKYLPPSVLEPLRAIQVAILYFLTLYYFYHEARSKKHL